MPVGCAIARGCCGAVGTAWPLGGRQKAVGISYPPGEGQHCLYACLGWLGSAETDVGPQQTAEPTP